MTVSLTPALPEGEGDSERAAHDFHGKARRSQAAGQPELRARTVPQQIKVMRLTLKQPADEEPLEWLLVTNLPVETAAQLRSGLTRYFHFYNARRRHSLGNGQSFAAEC
jgi:hypothetical protein